MNGFKRFLSDETGAVTVDWVVLTAGVVVFAVFVMPPIQSAILDMAEYIGETILVYRQFLQ
jgi:Flp pilus assembly pilin Flp